MTRTLVVCCVFFLSARAFLCPPAGRPSTSVQKKPGFTEEEIEFLAKKRNEQFDSVCVTNPGDVDIMTLLDHSEKKKTIAMLPEVTNDWVHSVLRQCNTKYRGASPGAAAYYDPKPQGDFGPRLAFSGGAVAQMPQRPPIEQDEGPRTISRQRAAADVESTVHLAERAAPDKNPEDVTPNYFYQVGGFTEEEKEEDDDDELRPTTPPSYRYHDELDWNRGTTTTTTTTTPSE
eukprot:CAMPEP_0118905366 /NCGR_PEP_ID=MMETSP1166-20130328/9412_1 /TAXON_ID=1104430 /ORGANISM="Chrysoreinhardia sp, Strain CCMP3193" /LENGTH=231 /DNA_ID=CAMNT_0006844637 /DNA_START=36 /DNA_END=731 /DNA_ORIENTATION=+